MDRFYEIRELFFRYYSAAGGHAFGVSFLGFIDLMQQSKLLGLDEEYSTKRKDSAK